QAMLRVFPSILPYAAGCPKVLVRANARMRTTGCPAKLVGWEGACVRLCLLSDYSVIPSTAAEMDYNLSTVHHCATALARQGHMVFCLLAAESLHAFWAEAALAPAADALPPTCRYIVPVQPYQCAGVRLLCVDQQVWQHLDLHTRLFTFVCL